MDPVQSTPSGSYEFSAADNDVFRTLAGKMRFVGTVLAVVGVIYLILGGMLLVRALTGEGIPLGQTKTPDGGVVVTNVRLGPEHSIGYLVGGILYLAMGGWTRTGAAAFRRIVDTAGSDIRHLMEAATNLRKLYTLQFWLILLALIVLVVVTVLVALRLAAG